MLFYLFQRSHHEEKSYFQLVILNPDVDVEILEVGHLYEKEEEL